MNLIDDNSPDPEDAQTGSHKEPELGRKFYWREKELAAYSFNYRVAYNRIVDGRMTNLESDCLFLYVLTRTPKQLDAVRTRDEISAFRLEMGEWAEKEKVEREYEELHRLVSEIQQVTDAADAIIPTLPHGDHSAPGNA